MSNVDSDEEEGDLFFDVCEDDIRSSTDASSSVECSTSDRVSASWRPEYEVWTSEPTSVEERRHRFLKGMGFAESIPTGIAFSQWQGENTADCAFGDLDEKISSICFTSCSSFSQKAAAPDSTYCIRDLDSRNRFVVREIKPRGLTGTLDGFGTDTVMNMNQFEGCFSFSQLVHGFSWKGRGGTPARRTNITYSVEQKDHKNFCGRFTIKKGEARFFMYHVPAKSMKASTMCRAKVQQQNKKWMDFSAVYMCQEIQAHRGSIRVMKFCPSGWYLASAGDDYIVRIWAIKEVESSPDLYGREPPGRKYMDRRMGLKMKRRKGGSRTLAIIPRKVFSISETPLHEFHGHTSDILDLTWSKSDFLLTASKDRTVRMWKVGCGVCLAVFKHINYVTCVQFNPVDERYFVSGSIDGKVRIWDVLENRVVDWDDTRDIITAVSFRPDGKGLVVGNVAGTCRFYDLSGQNMELEKVERVERNKSAGSQITSLQFAGGDPSRMVIASADSRIRVSDSVLGITQKFEGRWGAGALLPPSLTSDGRYLVSAGADSNVYVWNLDGGCRPRSGSVRSCELFPSKGVTSVATWPGLRERGDGVGDRRSPETGPTVCRDRDRCSFGAWFFFAADGARTTTSTWPEEKLLPSLKHVSCAGMDGCRGKVSAAWNTVVVTGGRDGVIRCFHNYGLPVKL